MSDEKNPDKKTIKRRKFIRNFAIIGGLTLSYGTFFSFIFRYLSPQKRAARKRRIFVALADEVKPEGSLTFSTPDGEKYLLTNRKTEEGYRYFAFSSRCPHLGCKVYWQPQQNRYFCPCHNGVFDAQGVATDGPPAKANQKLKSATIILEGQAIYVEMGEG